jgi:hypothetical protein
MRTVRRRRVTWNGRPVEPVPGSVVKASKVRSRSLTWAWENWITLGNVTPLSGREGVGKGMLEAHIGARWTRGELPGVFHHRAINLLILASEDGIDDTWKPRVDLERADLDRVNFWNTPDDWTIDQTPLLRAAIEQVGARVVIIEAVYDHLPSAHGAENANSAQFVREAMKPLKALARNLGVAVMYTMHPPKTAGTDSRSVFQGSQAWSAVPRTTLYVDWHPEDLEIFEHDRRRVLVRTKGNLGREPQPLEFEVDGKPYRHDDGIEQVREYVSSIGPSAMSKFELLKKPKAPHEPTKVEQAIKIMREELIGSEWKPSRPVIDKLEEAGCGAKATIRDAKARARVKTRKNGRTNWDWRLVD